MKGNAWRSFRKAYTEFKEVNSTGELYSNIYCKVSPAGEISEFWADSHTFSSWATYDNDDVHQITDVTPSRAAMNYPSFRTVLETVHEFESELQEAYSTGKEVN